jgi:autotransporter translocation and assembly factor TamB
MSATLSKPLKVCLVLLLIPLLALPVAAALLLALAGTETGTAFVVRQLQHQLDEQVTWQGLDGSLLGPLRLTNVTLMQPGMEAQLERLSLDWSPSALLQGKLLVSALQADGIRINLSTTEPETSASTPFRPGDVQLPLDISMPNITLSRLQVLSAGEPVVSIDDISLDAELTDNEVVLHSLALVMPEGTLSLQGRTHLSNEMPLALAAQWNWILPPAQGAAVLAEGLPITGNARIDGDLRWETAVSFDVNYRVRTEGQEALDPQVPNTLTATGLIRGVLGSEQLTVTDLTLALEETDLQLASTAEISGLSDDVPVIAATLAWQKLQWPLSASSPLIVSQSGEATINGSSAAFNVDMHADLAGQDIPPGSWHLRGSGDPEHLHIAALQGQVLGGELRLSGPVSWQPAPAWQLQLIGSGLDPAQLDPALSGQLSVALTTQGRLQADSALEAEVELQHLGGHMQGYPLQLTARANLLGEQVQLRQLQASSGGNQLNVSGQLSPQQLALDWSLTAPNPESFLPGASGSATASGTVAGSPDSPTLQAELMAPQLQLDELSVSSLAVTITAGLAAEAPLALKIDTGTLSQGETALLKRLQVSISGSNDQHRVAVDADTGQEQLRVNLAGSIDTATPGWRGTLQQLVATTADYGNWQLAAPATLEVSAEQIGLAQSCLHDSALGARLCAAGDWAADGAAQFSATLDALPLQLFVDQVAGNVSADLQGSVAANGALRADSTLRLSPGEVNIQLEHTRKTLSYQGGDISLQINERGLTAVADLATPEQGTIEARVTLPALNALPMAEQQPLSGRLRAALPDIAGFAAWVPDLGATAGSINADLTLGGLLQQPRVDGEISLRDGAASIPVAGLQLREIELRAVSEPAADGRLNISGGMRSGEGRLAISGSADLMTGNLAVQLTGDRFKAYDTADARLWVSPDLALGWRDNTLNVRGQLLIPEAAITPKLELSPVSAAGSAEGTPSPGQVIAPSPDVVVINSTVQSPPGLLETAAPFRIDSEINLVLGEAVNVNAVGFVSQITGAVTFTNTPEQAGLIPMANGRLALQGGTFRSFGQDLEIENGQIIFANVPATEPELNLRAVRWIDNDPQVTAAGVTVTGPLTQPVLELFSQPQLETSEIQSYLLTGRSPRSRDSVLSLGTYVSPRIYVGYGFNMVERTSEFNSLFTITPRYGVGANVGEADNNVNVTFSYER